MTSRRYDYCDSCVNADIDYECRGCRDGSKFESADSVEELTVHELRFMTLNHNEED
jgi:hypothetical protein